MLHQNPEISGFEENTAATVRAFLLKQNPTKIETQIGGHGIMATWHGNKPGKKLLFRAELDALPIQEKSKLPYSSIINNVAHLCGHDGHTAILCALATKLNQQNFSGEVSLLFQPAEETGQGAQLVLQSNQFKNLNFNYVFALHNLPGYN